MRIDWRCDRATWRSVSERRIRSRGLHRWRRGSNENHRWEQDQTGRRRSRSRFKWSAHQWLLAGAKNSVRENAAQTKFDSARIDNHDWRRTAARAQKLSAAPSKTSRWRTQRARSYHRRRSHRQFASNLAVEL